MDGRNKTGFTLLLLKTLPNCLRLEHKFPLDILALLEKKPEYRKAKLSWTGNN
jgi:hypothetical protein